MKEIDAIKKQVADYFDAGDAAALDRLYVVLNSLMAHLAVLRGILGVPNPAPEDELHLEMEDADRLDKLEPEKHWRAKP